MPTSSKNPFYKITWRLKFIIKSLPAIVQGFIFEKDSQPWRYIFDYWTLPASKRYSKSRYYIEKGLLPGLTLEGKNIILNGNVIDISSAPNGELCIIGIIAQYFDFIYPAKVKYTIPFFISEGPYEKDGCIIKADDTIIDAGANLGLFDWSFKPRLGKNARSYMFEPMPEIASILRKAIQVNNCGDSFFVVESALSDNDGFTSFSFEEFGGGSHELSEGKQNVSTIKLDTFMAQNNIHKVDYIKVDIEGMEPALIQGAAETIKKFKPRIAICTYHHKDHLEVLTKLIKDIRPDYNFSHSSHKLFAW